jgi:hypothetical protein
VFGVANAFAHGQGFGFAQQGSARISGLFGMTGVEVVTVQTKEGFAHLVRSGLGFLQANNVCIQLLKRLVKTLFDNGPQTVNIEGDEFHNLCA